MNRTSCLYLYVIIKTFKYNKLSNDDQSFKAINIKQTVMKMTNKLYSLYLLFIALSLSFFFLSKVNAQTINVSGTVYTDEGITPMAD